MQVFKSFQWCGDSFRFQLFLKEKKKGGKKKKERFTPGVETYLKKRCMNSGRDLVKGGRERREREKKES